MPKKKQIRNPFYFYMLDFKELHERNGEHFPEGLRDVQKVAGLSWDNLTDAEKQPYIDRAKEEKLRQKGDLTRKYTNQHTPFDFVEKLKYEEEEEKLRINKDIERTVRSQYSKKLLAEHRFYLIHVNYFCITEGECYHPAELAVAEFSLEDGVTNVYHDIINPGPIPLGYRFDAMQKSDSIHRIPLEFREGEHDFNSILKKIKRILQPGRRANEGVNPPIYTMPDNVNLNTSLSCVKSVMKTLCEATAGDDTEEMYRIYPLEKLFYEMNNACAEINGEEGSTVFPSLTVACSALEKDVFNYTTNIACSFHIKADAVENCSMSFVQRWAYLICDHCCQQLNIELIPGKHVPQHSDVGYRQRQMAREQEQGEASAPPRTRPFTIVDHGQRQKSDSGWFPVQQPPLPKPSIHSKLAMPHYETIDTSEDNFPAIPIGRGRGKNPPKAATSGRGAPPPSFADAIRKKK